MTDNARAALEILRDPSSFQWHVIPMLLVVIYIGRIVEAAYLRPPPEGRQPVREVGPWLLVPMWILVLANFWFGIDTDLTLGTATRGAEVLLGGAP